MPYDPIPAGQSTELDEVNGSIEWNKALEEWEKIATNSPAYAAWVEKNNRPAWQSHEPNRGRK